ncbi:ZIP zinc/iron transport family [Coccomyxa subellipsoidea C-169]|uniref:ZIP zinc/iron transport family n=1 Tax=Coccomyxa subellipsoidea (strain C-169) TaxID=574566 RepID=I0YZ52_COCSC|nr:ZIP zinc/iron transport family [Coccomyxa subellipsoidea C-169]EIE23671.1 ZIP zinc/iron transport family [Coccomyxa subellipsoidea C-169]|eukprot:XP_005648215.1 ZIP zinc/iron transport family [Coccomyxa subellipsoidea C-169]
MASVMTALGPVADAAAAPAPVEGGSCLGALENDCSNPELSHSLRIGAVFIILACSSLGIWLPYIAGKFALVGRETNLFLILKAFGAGVILATGFIHMFPDAASQFSNECLGWPDYPYASAIALVTIVVVLFLENLVSMAYERRMTRQLARPHSPEEGCANGACVPELDEKVIAQEDARVRSFAIAQVLETGIALHSVLIGIALGVSNSPCTIKPLLAALTFHQFFEGVALGSCLIQASILIYMALVDLIAVDFTTKRFRSSLSLQAGSYISLLAGCAVMAVIGIWA